MKKTFLLLLCFLLPNFSFTQSNAQESVPRFSLEWSDEFDLGYLNEEMWSYETGYVRNNERQYYRKENVSVRDSMLVITGERVGEGGISYASGSIHTRGKYSYQYGKIEIRAKLPDGDGLWPALWSCGYPSTPAMNQKYDDYAYYLYEIDIAELYGGALSGRTVNGVLHWPGTAEGAKKLSGELESPTGFSDEFHIFTLTWLPDFMSWAVDGREFFRVDLNREEMPGFFDLQQDLRINLAVTDLWSSSPDTNADLPCEMLVDYVRYYRLDCPKTQGMEFRNTDYPVPVRQYAENQGYSVLWDEAYQIASITDGLHTVSIQAGGKYLLLDKVPIYKMDFEATLQDGKLMLSKQYLEAALAVLRSKKS